MVQNKKYFSYKYELDASTRSQFRKAVKVRKLLALFPMPFVLTALLTKRTLFAVFHNNISLLLLFSSQLLCLPQQLRCFVAWFSFCILNGYNVFNLLRYSLCCYTSWFMKTSVLRCRIIVYNCCWKKNGNLLIAVFTSFFFLFSTSLRVVCNFSLKFNNLM